MADNDGTPVQPGAAGTTAVDKGSKKTPAENITDHNIWGHVKKHGKFPPALFMAILDVETGGTFNPYIYNYYYKKPGTQKKCKGVACATPGAGPVAEWKAEGDGGFKYDPHAVGLGQILDCIRLKGKKGGKSWPSYGDVSLPNLTDLVDPARNIEAVAGNLNLQWSRIQAKAADAPDNVKWALLYLAHNQGGGPLKKALASDASRGDVDALFAAAGSGMSGAPKTVALKVAGLVPKWQGKEGSSGGASPAAGDAAPSGGQSTPEDGASSPPAGDQCSPDDASASPPSGDQCNPEDGAPSGGDSPSGGSGSDGDGKCNPLVRGLPQWDRRWGSRKLHTGRWAPNGCHPCCIAMVLRWIAEDREPAGERIPFPKADDSEIREDYYPVRMIEKYWPGSKGVQPGSSVNHTKLLTSTVEHLKMEQEAGAKKRTAHVDLPSGEKARFDLIKKAIAKNVPVVVQLGKPAHFVLIHGWEGNDVFIVDPGNAIYNKWLSKTFGTPGEPVNKEPVKAPYQMKKGQGKPPDSQWSGKPGDGVAYDKKVKKAKDTRNLDELDARAYIRVDTTKTYQHISVDDNGDSKKDIKPTSWTYTFTPVKLLQTIKIMEIYVPGKAGG
jgi:hypothetical protein